MQLVLRVQGDPEVEMEETWNYLDADSDGHNQLLCCVIVTRRDRDRRNHTSGVKGRPCGSWHLTSAMGGANAW